MKKTTVLLVVSHAETAQAAQEILSSAGYRLQTVARGEDGVMSLMQARADAVVVDDRLSDMSLWQWLQQKRVAEVCAGVPVLLMCEKLPDEADKSRFQELGVTAFVSKPLQPEALLAGLQEAGAGCEPQHVHEPHPRSEEAAVSGGLQQLSDLACSIVGLATDLLSELETEIAEQHKLDILAIRNGGAKQLEILNAFTQEGSRGETTA